MSTPSPQAGVAFDIDWEEVTKVIDTGAVARVTQHDGSFFVLGSAPDGAAVWASDDGEQWRRSALPFPAGWTPGPPTFVVAEHLVAEDGALLVIGTASALDYLDAIVWMSADGTTWTEVDTGAFKTTAYRVLDATEGPAGIVVATHRYGAGTGSAWLSGDAGHTWTEHRPTAEPMTAYVVVGTADGYVIAGDEMDDATVGHPRIWLSTDGARWTPAAVDGSEGIGSVAHVTVGPDGTWVAAGTLDGRAVAWRSTDLATWTLSTDFGPANPETGTRVSVLTGVPEGFLAISVGSSGLQLWTSADGESWISRPIDTPTVEGAEGRAIMATGIGRIGDRLLLAGPVTTDLDPAGSTWHAWRGRLVPTPSDG